MYQKKSQSDLAKWMYQKKLKRFIIWNGGSTSERLAVDKVHSLNQINTKWCSPTATDLSWLQFGPLFETASIQNLMGQQSKCYTKRKWENRPNKHGLKDPQLLQHVIYPGSTWSALQNDPNNQWAKVVMNPMVRAASNKTFVSTPIPWD